ncbi:MAG: hypothetical protein IJK84_05665 [Bacteroidales bacterium]|nr:hypothetical protein [Bacteroidales bacterium]
MNGKEFDKKETELCIRWKNSYSEEMQKIFCFDGLIYYRDPNCKDEYAEVDKWVNTKRKVLFLVKDTNGNPGCDYREWAFYDTDEINVHRTFMTMIKCIWALNEVDANHLPVFDKTREEYFKLALPYPMAIVNVKKISGGSKVYNSTIQSYYERDRNFIVEQIRNILNPNVIVCGGGSGTLLNIAKDIYSDMVFLQYNEWCHFCQESNLLLIDDYHPSPRSHDDQGMINAVHDFYKKIII